MDKFKDSALYAFEGSTLNRLWQVYMTLITDDGTPDMAIKGDRRRDLAQRMGALLEHAEQVSEV